jgi:PhoH-like ATPase
MAPKNYVLDTNVLIYDANAMFRFEDNTVVIPMVVIEDISRMKRDMSENGRNARQIARNLDLLRREGTLTGGVALPGGGKLVVLSLNSSFQQRLPKDFRENTRDSILLASILQLGEQQPNSHTILVTKDLNVRIKADALGVEVVDYESDKVDIEELYSGMTELNLSATDLQQLNEKRELTLSRPLYPNQYVVAQTNELEMSPIIGRYDAAAAVVRKLNSINKEGISNIFPRNEEQIMAMDALLDDDIQLVTLVGKAGTGKTLLAVAASLYKTVEKNTYSRILVSRPTLPLGKDIGFLPGNVEDKLTPWMYPIADNVEFLTRDRTRGPRREKPGFKELISAGILVIEQLTYIRGRSIHNQFLIVDEAQNLTPHEIKTIITRVGDGTKIIVTGDPYQIDNPYIDSASNGLAYLVERFKGESISAHVSLRKGERSALSERAANLL